MSSDSIRVVCRLRPLNKIELANNGEECVSHTTKEITIKVNEYRYRWEDKSTNITLPSIEYLEWTLNKSKFIKKSAYRSLNQLLVDLMALFSLMGRPVEAKLGRCRY